MEIEQGVDVFIAPLGTPPPGMKRLGDVFVDHWRAKDGWFYCGHVARGIILEQQSAGTAYIRFENPLPFRHPDNALVTLGAESEDASRRFYFPRCQRLEKGEHPDLDTGALVFDTVSQLPRGIPPAPNEVWYKLEADLPGGMVYTAYSTKAMGADESTRRATHNGKIEGWGEAIAALRDAKGFAEYLAVDFLDMGTLHNPAGRRPIEQIISYLEWTVREKYQ